MSVNPYLAAPPQSAFVPTSAAKPVATKTPAKRKTNWLMMTGAFIELAIGFVTADYPTTEQILSDSQRAEAIGFVFGQAAGTMIMGAICGWILSLLIARPIWIVIVLGILGGFGALAWSTLPNRIINSLPARPSVSKPNQSRPSGSVSVKRIRRVFLIQPSRQ